MTNAPIIFTLLLAILLCACQQTPTVSDAEALSPEAVPLVSKVPVTLHSERCFIEAEHRVALGDYHAAAAHLHEGVVAFRRETGQVHGSEALRVNHAIDALTHLRRELDKGKSVRIEDVRRLVMDALELEPPGLYTPPSQNNDTDLFVPVSR